MLDLLRASVFGIRDVADCDSDRSAIELPSPVMVINGRILVLSQQP
jgi:hypothetical protein